MGDDDQRLLPPKEGVLEPQDGVEVQMIGGLIQQKHVGGDVEGAGQADTHPPPTWTIEDGIHTLMEIGGYARISFNTPGCASTFIFHNYVAGDFNLEAARFVGGSHENFGDSGI